MDRADSLGESVNAGDILRDVLDHGLSVIFCGSAVGNYSARTGSYYAHPQNKFWPILFETGLTSELLPSSRYRELPTYGIGLTDLVKSQSGVDHEISFAITRAESRQRLQRSIEQYEPRILAFTSKKAGQEFLGDNKLFGEQAETIGNTHIWILPSTSSAARKHWQPDIWHALANRIRATSG